MAHKREQGPKCETRRHNPLRTASLSPLLSDIGGGVVGHTLVLDIAPTFDTKFVFGAMHPPSGGKLKMQRSTWACEEEEAKCAAIKEAAWYGCMEDESNT